MKLASWKDSKLDFSSDPFSWTYLCREKCAQVVLPGELVKVQIMGLHVRPVDSESLMIRTFNSLLQWFFWNQHHTCPETEIWKTLLFIETKWKKSVPSFIHSFIHSRNQPWRVSCVSEVGKMSKTQSLIDLKMDKPTTQSCGFKDNLGRRNGRVMHDTCVLCFALCYSLQPGRI